MKILILGGTGVIGQELSKLLSKDNEVFVSSRRSMQNSGQVYYLRGSGNDVSFIDSLTEDWDVIIDLMNHAANEFSVLYEKLACKTKHYIFVSSSRVYADNGEKPISEKSPIHLNVSEDRNFLSSEEYAISKALSENSILTGKYDNWTIVRPYIIYGPTRLQLGPMEKEEWLYRALHGRTILFPESILDKQTTLTYCKDAALAICAVVKNENCKKQIYNITAPHHIKWSEVIDIYSKIFEEAVGTKMKIKYVDDNIFRRFRPGLSFYQISKDRVYNRIFSTEKLNSLVNCDDFINPSEGLCLCLRELLTKPSFSYHEWAIEGRKDRFTCEFASLREMRCLKERIVYLYNRLIKKQ